MKRHREPHVHRRRAFSLLETIAALSLAMLVIMPVVSLLHTTSRIRDSIDNDRFRRTMLHGALRQITRRVREAASLRAINANGPNLEVVNRVGQSERWEFDPVHRTVTYQHAGRSGILAERIESFEFTGVSASGAATTVPGEVRSIRCEGHVALRRNRNETHTAHCRVALRDYR